MSSKRPIYTDINSSKVSDPRSLNSFDCPAVQLQEESDKSLLIHDEQEYYEAFTQSSRLDKQIYDEDLSLEKINLINNPNYFKQLSLSFYGITPISTKNLSARQTSSREGASEASQRVNTASLSPRAQNILKARKSPGPSVDKDPFQLKLNTLAGKNMDNTKKDPYSYYSPRGEVPPTKGRRSEKNLFKAFDRPIGFGHPQDAKMAAIGNILKLDLGGSRTTVKAIFSQLGLENTTGSNSATLKSNKEAIYVTHRLDSGKRNPSVKASPLLLKGFTTNICATEPNSTLLKSPTSSNLLSGKQKVYALDKFGGINVKNTVAAEGRINSTRNSSREKLPMKPLFAKLAQGDGNTRTATPKQKFTGKNFCV